jgi:hypothetical protein
MDPEIVVYVHNEVLLSHKNNDMWFEGKWMELDYIMLSEVSQVQKDEDHMFSYLIVSE